MKSINYYSKLQSGDISHIIHHWYTLLLFTIVEERERHQPQVTDNTFPNQYVEESN